MSIKERLIKDYPLTKKAECPFEAYEIEKRKFVIFVDEKITRENTETLLDKFAKSIPNNCSEVRPFIVVGYTDEQFKPEDLSFFNGVDTFVIYYLKNIKNDEIYFNDQRMYFFSAGWRKTIKRFNEILMDYGVEEFNRLQFLTEYGFTVENHSNGRFTEIWCISDKGCIIYHEWFQFNDFDIFITSSADDFIKYKYQRTYNLSWLVSNVLPVYKQTFNVKKWEKIDLVEFYLREQIRNRGDVFGICLF